MKKLIQEVLESEQVLNLRDRSNREYITGLIMEAIRSEGWYLNIGTHRATTRPLSTDDDYVEHDGKLYKKARFYKELSEGIEDEVRYDGDGNKLDEHIPQHKRRVKSYGFFKNTYHDD